MERFSEVNGDLLRGGEPSESDLRILKNVWGVRRIVSLDRKIGLKLAPICAELELEQIIIPVGGEDVESALDYLNANVVSLLSGKRPTFVHCRFGRDRTGLAIALYRIQADGWSPGEAYKEALTFDFGDGLSEDYLKLFKSYLVKDKDSKEVSEKSDAAQIARRTTDMHPDSSENHFSPLNPGDMQSADDRRKRRRKLRKLVWQDINEAMALVGVNEGVSPILRNVSPDHTPHPTMPYGYSYIL